MNQYYFNASLLTFSSAVTVCILAGNLMERGRQDACTDIFHRLVILNLIYNLMGSLGEFYMYSGGARDHNFYRFTDVLLSVRMLTASWIPKRWACRSSSKVLAKVMIR